MRRDCIVTSPEVNAAGVTKAHVIDYYIRVSQWLLPHLRDRPITLKRYPDGVQGEYLYEKDAPSFTPEWVRTFSSAEANGRVGYQLHHH